MKPCAAAAGGPDRQGEPTVAALSRSDAELAAKTDLKKEVAALNAALKADLRQLRREITAVRSAILRSEWKAQLNAAVHKIVLGQIATAVWLFVAIKFL